MKISSLLTATIVVLSLTANAAPECFKDDFTKTGNAWRYGNAIHPTAGSLLLSTHAPEVTLSPTAVHPENLSEFRAIFKWNFGAVEKRELRIGWGKPFEFSQFSESTEQLTISAEGTVTMTVDGKKTGTARIPVSDKGDAVLAVHRLAGSVVVLVGGSETSFPAPVRGKEKGGYLTLRAHGLERGKPPLKLQYIEVTHRGKQPPKTEARRATDHQAWAAEKIRTNRDKLISFENQLKSESAAGRWGFKTDLSINPGLIKPNEKINLVFHCTDPLPQPCEAQVEPDFLSSNPGLPQPLPLHWQKTKEGYKALVTLRPDRCGNWRVTWKAGSEQLSRVFAVADRGYAICRFLITNDHALNKPNPDPAAHDAIHNFGLAADHWDGAEWVSPFSRSPENLLAHFRIRSELHHRWGDQFMPMCNANWMLPGCPDNNLWRFDDRIQSEGLKQIAQLWQMLGLGPLDVMASYTFGHSTPRIARSTGVKMLDSLVQWQNWRDGGDDNAWLINQWGAPTVPYYVADDDYRKVARKRGIVAFTQATTSSCRIYYINLLEGQPQLCYLRRRHYQSPQTKGDMAETMNADRFETTVDLWLAEAKHQSEPLFLSIGLENFVDSPDWNEANRRGVSYLCNQARNSRVVFAQAAAIADFYHRYYRHQPETWFYWPDIYAGYVAGYKPRQIPDRIELSNSDFHSLHEDGALVPRFLWDYTIPWNEPIWDDQRNIRQKFGLATPTLLNATNCVPRMVDLSGLSATVTFEIQPEGVIALVNIDSLRNLDILPLGIWHIPLKAGTCEARKLPRGTRFVPVVDGSTDNMHGVFICRNIRKGHTAFTFQLSGKSDQPLEPCFQVGADVRGRCFYRPSGTTAYVWLADGCQYTGILTIRVPEGRQVTVHYNDGQISQPCDGILHVNLNRDWQTESPMVSGLTAAEIQDRAKFNRDPAPFR